MILREDINQYKENVKKVRRLSEDKAYQHNLIDELKKDKQKYEIQMNNNSQSYNKWFDYVKMNFTTLKRMLDHTNIQLPTIEPEVSYSPNDLVSQSYPRSLPGGLLVKYREYQDLEREVSNQNADIADLGAELKVKNEKLVDIENTLHELCPNNRWIDYDTPENDLLHLASEVKSIDRAAKDVQATITTIQNEISMNQRVLKKAEEKLAELKADLEKEFKDKGAQYIEIDDCKAEKERYKKRKKDVVVKIEELRVEINGLKGMIGDIENITRQLASLDLRTSLSTDILTEDEKFQAIDSPSQFYTYWTTQFNALSKRESQYRDFLWDKINKIKVKIEEFEHVPEPYRNELLYFLNEIRGMGYDAAINDIDNYLDWAKHNLQDEMEQKKKAEQAIEIFVKRCSRRVMDIARELENIVTKMTVVNWTGERFPLVRYNKNYSFPNDIDDIRLVLHDFCLNEIEWYVKKSKKNIEILTVRDVAKTVNISNLFLKGIGDYPRLFIHIPGLGGELLRGSPKQAKYKEWEVINNASALSPTKSGGQTLMAHFIIIAMLLRQRSNDDSSLFLVTDNPFGTMSAKELVEAVFSMLDLLNIQWLVVGSISNVQATSNFNTIFNMSIKVDNGKKVLTTKRLVKNYRKYLDNISLLDNKGDKA